MFRVTFLGHQGWLLAGDRARLVIDPLFGEGVGDMREPLFHVYPPRALDVARFPEVDAVIVTHEHADHFDVPTLNRIDRRVPIWLSSRSSAAGRTLLREMGFRVHELRPGHAFTVGDLSVHPLSPDNWSMPLEWDTVPLLVRDLRGDGNFFCPVDLTPERQLVDDVRRILGAPEHPAERPVIWTEALNDMDPAFLGPWNRMNGNANADKVRSWTDNFKRFFSGWRPPEVFLCFGGGFSLAGEMAWMNSHAFTFDAARVCEGLAARHPGTRFLAPLPGTTISCERGHVTGVTQESFVAPLGREAWPAHDGAGTGAEVPTAIKPWSARTTLDAAEWQELEAELGAFARHLYGRPLFAALYRLRCADRLPTFALVLREEAAASVWEYRPERCAFARVECADPRARYAAVAECWAADLLAFFRVELTPGYFIIGRLWLWCALPDELRFDLDMALGVYMHPLLHAERFLAVLRRKLAAEPGADEPGLPRLRPGATALADRAS